MTARDFTPTDEQLSALGLDLMGLQEAAGDRAIYWLALPLTESPAFQSIIAAAKAEALREGFMQASILVDRWGYPTLSDDLDRHSPYREASA